MIRFIPKQSGNNFFKRTLDICETSPIKLKTELSQFILRFIFAKNLLRYGYYAIGSQILDTVHHFRDYTTRVFNLDT